MGFPVTEVFYSLLLLCCSSGGFEQKNDRWVERAKRIGMGEMRGYTVLVHQVYEPLGSGKTDPPQVERERALLSLLIIFAHRSLVARASEGRGQGRSEGDA